MIRFLQEFESAILKGEFEVPELYRTLDEVINVSLVKKSQFVEELLNYSLPVQHAFTKIAIEFIKLKAIDYKKGENYYDHRNSFIVKESNNINQFISLYHYGFKEELDALTMMNDIIPVCNLDQLEKYLFLTDVDILINKISNSHRTLQNNFGYLIIEWILVNLKRGNDIFPVSIKYLETLQEDFVENYLNKQEIY